MLGIAYFIHFKIASSLPLSDIATDTVASSSDILDHLSTL